MAGLNFCQAGNRDPPPGTRRKTFFPVGGQRNSHGDFYREDLQANVQFTAHGGASRSAKLSQSNTSESNFYSMVLNKRIVLNKRYIQDIFIAKKAYM